MRYACSTTVLVKATPQWASQTPSTKIHSLKSLQQRWVPKALLETQGFYDDKCQVWIP